MIDTEIDWARIAKPQPDGYDTLTMGRFMYDRWHWKKSHPTSGAMTLVAGQVEVCPDPYKYHSPYCQDSLATPEELEVIDRHLAAWPDGYASLSKFLDQFWPKRWEGQGRGGSSGHHVLSERQQQTNVFVTVNDPEGCAEGIYHEVGHLRLEAIGMNINDHDGRLISNPIEDLYDSPVRKDVRRPMCAVIHGLYAWMMLSENDVWCASTVSKIEAAQYLRLNIPKIAEGIEEVERYVQPTGIGEPFIQSMMDWAKDIVVRGNQILADV